MKLRLRRVDGVLDEIEVMQRRIAQRAHAIFRDGGGAVGHAIDHWLKAERETIWRPALEVRRTTEAFVIEAAVAGVDAKQFDVRLTPTEPAMLARMRQAAEQSVQIIERRLNAFGLVEPSIQRQGADRILVQVPGFDNPEKLFEGLKPAKLTFRLVDSSMTAEQAQQGRPPPDSEIVPASTPGEGM